MSHDYTSELDCAREAALQAGAQLRRAFHALAVGKLEDAQEADHLAEEEIHQILMVRFPQYGYLGEETGPGRPPQDAEGHVWLVDPHDGTSAFEKGFRGAAVSIALLRNARPVLGVVYAYGAPDDSGDLFTWAEGTVLARNGRPVSRGAVPGTVLVAHYADSASQAYAERVAPLRFRGVTSIAYRLALVAAAEAVAALSLNAPVGWDYAGGHALLLGAGLDLYDARGRAIQYDRNGNSRSLGCCFGGPHDVVQQLIAHDWRSLPTHHEPGTGPYVLCWPRPGLAIPDAGLLSRAQGCLLGQLAGDALGGLVEFQRAESIRSKYPDGVRLLADNGYWGNLAGQPTDDSEMALLLARSILSAGGYDPETAARAYGWWYRSEPFDIGTTTRAAVSAAAQALQAGAFAAPAAREAALRDKDSNGALMRASPLGIVGAGAEVGAAGSWATQDALLTHPHPVCQHANRIYVEAIAYAIRSGAEPADVYRFTLEVAERAETPQSVKDALVRAASSPPEDYYTKMGWVLIALQNAFWQLLHAPSLEEGVVSTVKAGGDTDTNAAIAGALLGAVHGRTGIPLQWRDRVLTCRPLAGPGVRHPRPEALWPVDALQVAERLLWVGQHPGE